MTCSTILGFRRSLPTGLRYDRRTFEQILFHVQLHCPTLTGRDEIGLHSGYTDRRNTKGLQENHL